MSHAWIRPSDRVRYFATPEGWCTGVVVKVHPLEWPWHCEYEVIPDHKRKPGICVQPTIRLLRACVEKSEVAR